MDSEEELAAAVVFYVLENKIKRKNGKKSSASVTSWFTRRDVLGF